MLNKPFIINNRNKLETIFGEENFVVVDLFKDLELTLVNNYIVEAILEKYPEKENFFKSIMFSKYEEFTWNKPMFDASLYERLQEEFLNIHILFKNYDDLSDGLRIFINTLLRMGFEKSSGKLFFHILSKYTYQDLISKGYSFNTFSTYDKLLLDEDIFNL